MQLITRISTIFIIFILSTLPCAAVSHHCRFSGDCEGSYGSSPPGWLVFLFIGFLAIWFIHSLITKSRMTIVLTILPVGAFIAFYGTHKLLTANDFDGIFAILISVGAGILWWYIWERVGKKIAPEINETD